LAELMTLLSEHLCTVYWAKHTIIRAYMLPAVSLL